MSLLEKAAFRLINGKRTVTAPIFIKEFEKENQQLKDLIDLSNRVSSDKKKLIDRDIIFLKQGLDGEQNVQYELKNSFIPMLCLHDIRIEYDDYVAQIDFVIITNKFIMVLEAKKLNGDIEITSGGDFIRSLKSNSGKAFKKEGMYSPISQNERHVNILRKILIKEGIIKTLPIKSAVILANPKTIVNKSKAPKSIQNNIYKYDQITNLLKKELNDDKNTRNMLEKYMYEISDFLIKNNKPITMNNRDKYSLIEEDFIKNEHKVSTEVYTKKVKESRKQPEKIITIVKPINDDSKTYELLKKYRLNTSREEGIKPYLIFNNEELDALIKSKPKTKDDLQQVKGFGPKKIEKYGNEILEIFNVRK
ncbi:MAG TPA: NERD domain-containing protein [Clostridium sp.]|uniref:NERD domain-containing protein n=1 Tax=Clostridium sp. TaxID=1506 RepID=UPI002F94ACD1